MDPRADREGRAQHHADSCSRFQLWLWNAQGCHRSHVHQRGRAHRHHRADARERRFEPSANVRRRA
eukprot:6359426-Pyramimonas_sp.AAC.1